MNNFRIEESYFLQEIKIILIYRRILLERPPFYKGMMPLEYLAGLTEEYSPAKGTLDRWYEFDGWKVIAGYSDIRWPADSAKAQNKEGNLLAELRICLDESSTQYYNFQEIHYNRDRTVSFECSSIFSRDHFKYQWGYKIKELDKKCLKNKEYFFLIP